MFLPIRTERQPRRTPRVTQAIILLNLLVYLAGVLGEAFGRLEPGAMQEAGQFVMSDFRAWQLFTYQFMHDPHGLGHLAFNMLFLWIFGTSVEDRLGRVGFICFYLLGGAAAGLVHGWIAPRIGIIGASGSIAAVTGAFMVLFPRSHIVIISLFGVFTPPAPWVILFFVAMDLFRASGSFGGGDNVAHAAHLAGYGYGIAIAFTLLATGLLARDDLDLFFLFKQKRRRNQFKTLSRRQVGGAWADRSKDTAEQAAAKIGPGRLSARDQRIAELRAEVTRRSEAHDLAGATRSYLDLIALDPTSTLSETTQSEIAARLFSDGDYTHAAIAFERLLDTYRNHDPSRQTQLLLALIYTRHEPRPDRARQLLDYVEARAGDAQKALIAMLRAELAGT